MKKNWQVMMGCFVTALMLVACSRQDDIPDLKAFIENLRTAAAKQQQGKVLAALKTPTPFVYTSDSARSPFTEAQVLMAGSGNMTNPLLGYPLTVLRFVGTITQGAVTYAFVAVPDNMIYQVKDGDKLGDQNGTVIDVQADKLSVMESAAKDGKGSMQRIVTLELRE